MPNLPAVPPLLAASETSALYIAGGLIFMVTILTLAAIVKSGADGGLKMFAALGVLIGAIPTYFLTQKSNEQALARRDAEIRARVAQVGELKAQLAESKIQWVNPSGGSMQMGGPAPTMGSTKMTKFRDALGNAADAYTLPINKKYELGNPEYREKNLNYMFDGHKEEPK